MSEENRVLARRFYDEVINKGNLDAVDELCAPNFVIHTPPSPPGMAGGAEGVKQMVTMYRGAFPDLQATPEEMVVEGDTVVVRMSMRGTHLGDLMGIPPTGKQFNTKGMDLIHISGGKATEVWHFEEELAFWQQLGIEPPPME